MPDAKNSHIGVVLGGCSEWDFNFYKCSFSSTVHSLSWADVWDWEAKARGTTVRTAVIHCWKYGDVPVLPS